MTRKCMRQFNILLQPHYIS